MSNARRKFARGAVIAGLAATSVLVGGVAHAAPPPPPDASDLPADRVAVATPALAILLFGDTVLVNVGCAFTSSYVASTMQEFGIAGSGDFADATANGCGEFAAAGGQAILQGMNAIAPAAAINPFVNPQITAFAAAVREFGIAQEAALTPFGPTVASFADGIEFFRGSEPK